MFEKSWLKSINYNNETSKQNMEISMKFSTTRCLEIILWHCMLSYTKHFCWIIINLPTIQNGCIRHQNEQHEKTTKDVGTNQKQFEINMGLQWIFRNKKTKLSLYRMQYILGVFENVCICEMTYKYCSNPFENILIWPFIL